MVGTGGTVASYDPRIRRAIRARGLLDGPDQPVPDVAAPEPRESTFRSRLMNRDVGYAIATPERRSDVMLVCLHGRAVDHMYAFRVAGVHKFVAEQRLPYTVASVSGGDASYWHKRQDGTDAQRMVAEEFIPLVARTLPRHTDPRIVLLGWSMGGYGALLQAAADPERFAAVCVTGPAVWRRATQVAVGAFDGPTDFAAHDLFDKADALNRARLRIDVGRYDPFAPAVEDLMRAVPSAIGGLRDGAHDNQTFRSAIPDQLDFVRAGLRST